MHWEHHTPRIAAGFTLDEFRRTQAAGHVFRGNDQQANYALTMFHGCGKWPHGTCFYEYEYVVSTECNIKLIGHEWCQWWHSDVQCGGL